jgi:DNA-binding NtrC family response regulator
LKTGGFSESAMCGLLAHRWPGNVRELQNVVERAAILAEENVPISAELMGLVAPPASAVATPPVAAKGSDQPAVEEMESVTLPSSNGAVIPLHEMEKQAILEALKKTDGNRTHAAELLQISIRTLRNKLAEYRLQEAEPSA